MKLKRRDILLAFFTFLGLNNFKVNAQSTNLLSHFNKEPLIPPEFDKDRIYNNFLQAAAGGMEDQPVLLYQRINTSPYKDQIKDYPVRLTQKPDNHTLINGTAINSTFSSYPLIGERPEIDEQGLSFLHEDIKEACLCVGTFDQGEVKTKWLGRNALSTQEFWSGTKIIPLLQLISRLNHDFPDKDIDYCQIQRGNQDEIATSFLFSDLARDLISYENRIASSNALGGMFQRFAPELELENWLKSITGNTNVVFRGRYGEKPFIDQPELVDAITGDVLITADPNPANWACNQVSAYDLTRLISMLGWHHYIPLESRIPHAKWHSLESLIRAMGTDPARLTDLAIKALGLETVLDSVVVLSKEGDGATSLRERTEAVYVALVQFIDRRFQQVGGSAQYFTLSMALRGGKALEPRDKDREVVELDARIATEVTEILYRLLRNKLI